MKNLFKLFFKENEETRQGAKIVELCQNLDCEPQILAIVSAAIMHERGLMCDIKPSWDEILAWVERNQKTVKSHLQELAQKEKK